MEDYTITEKDLKAYRSNPDRARRDQKVHDARILLTGMVIGAGIFVVLIVVEMMISGAHHNMLNIGYLPA